MQPFAILLLIVLRLLPSPEAPVRKEPAPGLSVVELGHDTVLEASGVRPGDILLSWEREPNPPANPEREVGQLASYFDWSWLLEEQVPRGSVKLRGQREGKPFEIQIAPGRWRAVVRPTLSGVALAEFNYIRALANRNAFEDIDSRLSEFLKSHAEDLTPETACWFEILGGHYSSKAGNPARARSWHERALAKSPNSVARVYSLQSIGITLQDENNFSRAEQFYRQALSVSESSWEKKNLMAVTSLKAIYLLAWRQRDMPKVQEYAGRVVTLLEEQAPYSLLQADTLNFLGSLANRSSDFIRAEQYHEKALAIRKLRDPGGISVAESLIGLGNIAFRKDDFRRAQAHYGEAKSILEVKGLDSEALPPLLANLGKVKSALGDFEGAEQELLKALELYPKLSPAARIERVSTLNSLSLLAQSRGDLAQAEDWSQQAVLELRKTAPLSSELAGAIRALGSLRFRLGDLQRAEDHFQEALAISKATSSDHLDEAAALSSLGRIAHSKGDLKKAEELYTGALIINERLIPQSRPVATILHNLGELFRDRNELPMALSFFRKALTIQEAIASPDAAVSLKQIGSLLRQMGNSHEALENHRRALSLVEGVVPGTSAESDILYEMSRDLSALGLREEALSALRRCVIALNSQVARIGAEDDRAAFRHRFSAYYRELIHALHELGMTEDSFEALEAFRGKSFLALLSERDLVFADIPVELERERRRIAVDLDAIHRAMLELDAREKEKRLALAQRSRSIREEQNLLSRRIRSLAPKLATLRNPESLDLAGMKQSIDPGTILVSFSVGKESTLVFALMAGGNLKAFRIPVGERELAQRVSQFRALLVSAPSQPARKATILAASCDLYNLLLRPVDPWIQQAQRLLIIPDGPIHALPFLALTREETDVSKLMDRPWRYLAEWKSLHFVLSATVYYELKHAQSSMPPNARNLPPFVGFGDPLYPERLRSSDTSDAPDGQLRRAAEIYRFTEIPWTHQEISRVAELFTGTARVYLRQEATETSAKATGAINPRFLHFATHGILDEQFPLNSALVLTIPQDFERGQENGLLQAWEIFEGFRIDADLVVLSACETALGKEMGGEGLIGLTRAFQYAGARTVMASLWKISDRTTAEFMVRFYKHFKEGMSKDEALRAVQMEFIRGPIKIKNEKGEEEEFDASAPYYWAAFQLYGDWK